MGTKDRIMHFISYVFVGGIATVVEWLCYYFFDPILHFNTYVAVALSFVFSTFANWLAGRLITFRNARKQSLIKELMSVYGASVIGLLMNEGIMLIFLNVIFEKQTDLEKMCAKVVATGIVFFWNYFIRTFIIYRKREL